DGRIDGVHHLFQGRSGLGAELLRNRREPRRVRIDGPEMRAKTRTPSQHRKEIGFGNGPTADDGKPQPHQSLLIVEPTVPNRPWHSSRHTVWICSELYSEYHDRARTSFCFVHPGRSDRRQFRASGGKGNNVEATERGSVASVRRHDQTARPHGAEIIELGD